MRRITSSLRPAGTTSDSISVVKPYLYGWVTWLSMLVVMLAPGQPGVWRHSRSPRTRMRYNPAVCMRRGEHRFAECHEGIPPRPHTTPGISPRWPEPHNCAVQAIAEKY